MEETTGQTWIWQEPSNKDCSSWSLLIQLDCSSCSKRYAVVMLGLVWDNRLVQMTRDATVFYDSIASSIRHRGWSEDSRVRM